LNLFVRYQFTYVFRFDGGHGGRLSQLPLALLVLARQYMAFIAFVAFDFAAAGNAKSFRGRSVGFNLWHFSLL
jgi:hypothetical protein